jgi:hypothetical protein
VTVEQLESDLMLQWAVEHGLQVDAEALFEHFGADVEG